VSAKVSLVTLVLPRPAAAHESLLTPALDRPKRHSPRPGCTTFPTSNHTFLTFSELTHTLDIYLPASQKVAAWCRHSRPTTFYPSLRSTDPA
jgi:hypothetical protein